MKVDPSKDGKENVLVMTDAFSKFSTAAVMPNQQAKTVAWWISGFTLMESHLKYTVTTVKTLIITSLRKCARFMV